MGVVTAGHIWQEIPTCNDYDVIFGGESQPAVDSDVTSCHKAI